MSKSLGPGSTPPPAAGVRLRWEDVPARVRSAVAVRLGSEIATVASQPSGFSPGAAVRLRLADGRRLFIKAAGPEPNREAPRLHRREAMVVAALPPDAPVPRLLWSHDEGDDGWVVLAFEDVEGRHPTQPWRDDELSSVLEALEALSVVLTPPPSRADVGRVADWGVLSAGRWRQVRNERPPMLDAWSARHLDALVALEAGATVAATGETLLHLDLRADNLLLMPERVLVVDWPHARVGAPWLDLAFFAPSVAMRGGPDPETLLARSAAGRVADPEAVTAAVAALAGFFTCQALRPPPPGLPTLRAFQAAQGIEARAWLSFRTGRC